MKIEIFKRSLNDNMFILIFSAVYYGIIIILAGYLNIWEDELYSLNTSSGNLSYALHQSFNFEQQPPVYFLLLTIWRSVSSSILWARMLNILLIIISQFIIFRFLKSFVNKKLAACFSILFILNPIIIFTILEIRLYALVIFLSLIITVYFFNTYYNNKITTGKRLFFILLAALGMFTQYYIGFLLLANAVVLLIKKETKLFWIYILDMVVPLVLTMMVLPFILLHAKAQAGMVPVYDRSIMDFLIEVKNLISQMTFGNFLPSDLITSVFLRWAFRGVVLILFLISIRFKLIKQKWNDFSPFVIIPFIIMLIFVLVDYQFGKYFVEYKYILVVFVPLFILIAIIFNHIRINFLIIWVILLSIFYICLNFNKYQELYKVDDYRKISKYLEQNGKKGEPIFVYRNIIAEILNIYYSGTNEIYPVPDPFLYNHGFNPELWELKENDIKNLGKKIDKYHYFYVVILDSSLKEFKESKDALTDFLMHNYKLESESNFQRFYLYKFSTALEYQ